MKSTDLRGDYGEYGQRIRAILDQRGVKYIDAASEMGTTYQKLFRLINGQRPCYADDLLLLRKIDIDPLTVLVGDHNDG